jgi:multicomponent K+:H+ antiporter subunit D
MIHSTLACAVLFLVVDLVRARRMDGGDGFEPAPPIAQAGLVSALYFAAAVAMAGLPPLAGFVGKLLILDAFRTHELVWLIWSLILVTSLMLIVGFTRAGSAVFWQTSTSPVKERPIEANSSLTFVAVFGLIGAIILVTVLARPVSDFLGDTARQIHDPAMYINSVLKRPGVVAP